jgi:hypothetical protein
MSAGLVLLLCAFPPVANPQNQTPVSKDKLDRLIVYGDGFAFGVKEPDGWRADTEDLARKYHVNVLFAPAKQDGSSDITIRVRLNKKVDENTIEDLNYDMEQYKKDYPKAKFNDLLVQHPDYKTFGKLVYMPDNFYEYVAYINPGPISKFTFSAAMSKRLRPATQEELNAFDSVLRSLIWLSGFTPQK